MHTEQQEHGRLVCQTEENVRKLLRGGEEGEETDERKRREERKGNECNPFDKKQKI